MSLMKVRKGRHRGGRPRLGMPNDNPNTVKHHIVVDDEFWAMLESERKPEETNNDALWRMFTTRTNTIQDLQKKCDALENVILLRNPEQEVIQYDRK